MAGGLLSNRLVTSEAAFSLNLKYIFYHDLKTHSATVNSIFRYIYKIHSTTVNYIFIALSKCNLARRNIFPQD